MATAVTTPNVLVSFAALEDRVREGLASTRTPGAAIALHHGDREYVGGFGVTNVAHPLPVDGDTVFRVQSISKTFTGTALVRLIDQGKLALDAPVRTYLPDFALADEDAAATITLRHLVTHRTGLRPASFGSLGGGEEELARFVARLRELRQETPPGAVWSYSNLGPNVAGRLIEIVTGKTFEAALAELVIDPLGLRDTFYFAINALGRRLAWGHERTDSGPRPVSLPSAGPEIRYGNPSGGLYSTARDLVRFARFHLRDGVTEDGQRLIGADSLRFMRSALDPQGATGLGFFRFDYGRAVGVGHNGGGAGVTNELLLVPERDFALVVLSNGGPRGDALFGLAFAASIQDHGILGGLGRWALGEYLQLEPQIEPAAATAADPSALLGRYEGAFTVAEISEGPDGLQLSIVPQPGDPPPPMRLALDGPDRFVIADGPAAGLRCEVLRWRDGRAEWIRLSFGVLVRTS